MPCIVAEWETHLCCLMAWPWRSDIWYGGLLVPMQREIRQLAQAISEHEPVVMLVPLRESARPCTADWPENISCVPFDYDDIWLRDTAPIWLSDGTAIEPRFNAWGRKDLPNGMRIPYRRDAGLAMRVCAALDVTRRDFGLILEGGALESDGQGTLWLTESNMLSPNRNGLDGTEPQGAKRFVESTIAEQLNANIQWLPGGYDEADLTDGHIDAIARFTPTGAVLYDDYDAEAPDAMADGEYQTIADNAAAVRRLSDRAISLQRPRGLLANDCECYSYANFYVGNGAVFVPSFRAGDPAEQEIHRRIGEQFPGRQIVPLALPTLLQLSGGGIHCVVRDVPQTIIGDLDDFIEKLESYKPPEPGGGPRIEAESACVVKLGEKGIWADECLGRGTVRFGFNEIPEGHEGRHHSMGLFWPPPEEAASNSIWIAFSEGLLWWTRPTGQSRYLGMEQENSSRDKELSCAPWSCANAKGSRLHVQLLPGQLQQLQFTRRTGRRLTEDATRQLLQVLDGEPSDTRRALESLSSQWKTLCEEAIRALSPRNLESLVDMMFLKAGFLRLTEFGGTMRDIDGLYQASTLTAMAFQGPGNPPKRIAIQVKQIADANDLERYRGIFFEYGSGFADEFWFIVAQPRGLSEQTSEEQTSDVQERFRYIGPQQLVEWIIELGFVQWLVSMS